MPKRNEIDKPLARLIKEKKKKKRRAQINKIRNKKEKSMEIAQKLKTKLPYDPKIPHLGIIQIK